MSKRKRPKTGDGTLPPPRNTRAWSSARAVAVAALAIAVVAAGGLVWWRSQHTSPGSTNSAGGLRLTSQIASTRNAQGALEKLIGKWRRPDGGYVIEVRAIEQTGRMDASYFNPQAINVSKAQASYEAGTTRVFIELRDVNYPGSTYHLTFEPDRDRLRGIYHQPALGQRFEVAFSRVQ
jgi:hypothetical protein